jgi:phosphatidylethanolamine/phosphatidyl-N-methylethanolamine N-methyltransferase
MKKEWVIETYGRYARIYDSIFGKVLEPGRHEALKRMQVHRGQKVLEIGVGTGLSLPSYPTGVSVTGIDICPQMLAKARARVERLRLSGVQLRRMDAASLDFPKATFDISVAMYVVSVAADPLGVISEMLRVTRPGGSVYVVNHFSGRHTWMEKLERIASPFAHWLGFEPLFYLDDFIARIGVTPTSIWKVPPVGFWRVLEIKVPRVRKKTRRGR